MRKNDRAPGWVLALSGLVLAVLVIGAAYVVVEGGTDYPSEWDPRVSAIADWLEDERGLEFDHPVHVEFLTPEEYTSIASVDTPESDEAAQDVEDLESVLRALGLVHGDVDLQGATSTLNDSGTLAFYSPSEERVYVRGTEVNAELKVTLAHELVHVLQDQHFDLERMSSMTSSESDVLRALAEGEAALIEDVFAEEELTDDERAEYEAVDHSDEIEAIEDEVPPALTTFFVAPYTFGPVLARYLTEQGDEALEEAFVDVPTEEVLYDPLQFGLDSSEWIEVDADLPDGAEEIERSPFGPISWYVVLASRLDPRIAMEAVDGFGGDEMVIYRHDDRVCVRMTFVGDDDAESDEMLGALEVWSAMSPEGSSRVERVDKEIQLQSCDPGTDAEAVGEAFPEMLALPILRTSSYMEVMNSGGDEEQAECYSQAVVENLSIDDLLADELTPELEGTIMGLALSCR